MDPDAGGYYPPDGGGHHAGLVIVILLVLLLVLGAGVALGGYMARQQQAARRAASRKAIFEDVERALKKALEKREEELLSAAKDLIKVIMDRLGPFVALGGPIFADIGALTKALTGKTSEPAPHGDHGDHAGHGGKGDHGHGAAEASTSAAKVGSTLVLTPNVTTHIHVGGEAEKKKDDHGHAEKPKERDMTMPQVYEAVGKAVEKFRNDWQKDKVETFLIAAQKALLEAKPSEHPPERH